jgi:hypothetical protein
LIGSQLEETIVKKSLFALTLGALVLGSAAAAQAQVSVSVGGHLSMGGAIGVSVGHRGWRRPYHRHSHARVIVGGGVYAWGYGGFAEPPPPPADPCCCCEPPPPPPVYYAPVDPPPDTSVGVVYHPRPRRIGLGARVSTTQLSAGAQGPESDGLGAVLRFRGRRAELELELGQEEFRHIERQDLRVGATAYLHLTGGRLRPYLLLGAGVNLVDNYYGRRDQQQGYLEGGGGLALLFGDRFSLNGDVRWSSRRLLEDDSDYHTTELYVPEREKGFEGRLTAVIYF